MKRNLVPFLGIAFVVAVAATGIFYGLFVDKISGAPSAAAAPARIVVLSRAVTRGTVLTEADLKLSPPRGARPEGAVGSMEEAVGRVALKPLAANEALMASGLSAGKGAALLPIPAGMRAISIRVTDSAGLMPYVREGHRIDVQSIQAAPGGASAVRTLLSNVEVLSLHVDVNPQPSPQAVLNLLVPARDVERVALADSASKLRIVLRSESDREEAPAAAQPAAQRRAAAPGTAGPPVNFAVRIAAAAAETVREIAARAEAAGGEGGIRIGVLPSGWQAETVLRQMEREKALRMLSTETLESTQWSEVSLRAGGEGRGGYDLRLGLTPRGAVNGKQRVRLRPELSVPSRGGWSTRRFSTDLLVADGQSVLMAGFERDASAPSLAGKLFPAPGGDADGAELLLVVTPAVAAK